MTFSKMSLGLKVVVDKMLENVKIFILFKVKKNSIDESSCHRLENAALNQNQNIRVEENHLVDSEHSLT
jgi:hypothetical protein